MMTATWTCPNCGGEMRKLNDFTTPVFVCSSCGCSLEAEEQNFENGSLCPNCNRLHETGNECPHCGYDLGSDFD